MRMGKINKYVRLLTNFLYALLPAHANLVFCAVYR